MPITPSPTALFFFLCERVHDDARILSSRPANITQDLRRSSIVERYAAGSESDWRELTTVAESVLKRIASAPESIRGAAKSTLPRTSREQLLKDGLSTLEHSLSPSGLKAVEQQIKIIRSGITGVRLTYVP